MHLNCTKAERKQCFKVPHNSVSFFIAMFFLEHKLYAAESFTPNQIIGSIDQKHRITTPSSVYQCMQCVLESEVRKQVKADYKDVVSPDMYNSTHCKFYTVQSTPTVLLTILVLLLALEKPQELLLISYFSSSFSLLCLTD